MEAVMAPSATGSGIALAIFIGNRSAGSSLEVLAMEPYRMAGMSEDGT
jgi:hypothetical protein